MLDIKNHLAHILKHAIKRGGNVMQVASRIHDMVDDIPLQHITSQVEEVIKAGRVITDAVDEILGGSHSVTTSAVDEHDDYTYPEDDDD